MGKWGFTPTKRGWVQKFLAMVVLTQELEVFSHTEGGGGRGGARSFHPLKEGHDKFYPVLRGGGGKVSYPRFSHFVASPLPVMNDRSLNMVTLYRPRPPLRYYDTLISSFPPLIDNDQVLSSPISILCIDLQDLIPVRCMQIMSFQIATYPK